MLWCQLNILFDSAVLNKEAIILSIFFKKKIDYISFMLLGSYSHKFHCSKQNFELRKIRVVQRLTKMSSEFPIVMFKRFDLLPVAAE